MVQKQEHERKSMEMLQEKQAATDLELKLKTEILRDIEDKFEYFKQQADQEEKFLAQRILSLSNELNRKLYVSHKEFLHICYFMHFFMFFFHSLKIQITRLNFASLS